MKLKLQNDLTNIFKILLINYDDLQNNKVKFL